MPNYKKQHKELLRRQKIYENKYARRYNSYLNSVNYSVARWIIENNSLTPNIDAFLNDNRVESIYRSLYKEVTMTEGKIQLELFNDPKQKKDLIDDLINIVPESQPINIWQRLLSEFITVRIAGRITNVNTTTKKRISILIERGIEEGLGAKEIAKTIRQDKKYTKNRSLAIARTETITSANQGKYMAALSSPFVKQKRWLPAEDERTRLSHLDFADRPFVDMNQMFFVANNDGVLEQARFPCDSTLSASNVVNCRCIVVFRNKLDTNGNPIRKNPFNFKP